MPRSEYQSDHSLNSHTFVALCFVQSCEGLNEQALLTILGTCLLNLYFVCGDHYKVYMDISEYKTKSTSQKTKIRNNQLMSQPTVTVLLH